MLSEAHSIGVDAVAVAVLPEVTVKAVETGKGMAVRIGSVNAILATSQMRARAVLGTDG